MLIDSVVCFKWTPPPGYRSIFTADSVNTLHAMVRRHYPFPCRFICLTDDPQGIDQAVEVQPVWTDFAELSSPHDVNSRKKNPSCYRRLRLFSADAASQLGQRFVALDLDCVITGDLAALWQLEEDFVMWGDTNPHTHYNGSMVLMTAGVRRHVWETFDPLRSPREARAAGCFGSDQGWISYRLGPGERKWGKADGVYSFRNDIKAHRTLPADARIVFFHGSDDPWDRRVQNEYPWIRRHYVGAEVAA